MDEQAIASDLLTVTIRARGAEAVSLRHVTAGEMLWQAGPIWPRHSPLLFPVVGELANGGLRHDGTFYPLQRHGFARTCDFAWLERDAASCTLRLVDDAETRARFPFRFEVRLRYAVAGSTLTATYTVTNPAETVLPMSIGAHPAFRWPLVDGMAKDDYAIVFEEDEPEAIRRLSDGLLDPRSHPTPVRGRELRLDQSLFDADAIVMDRPRSHAVRYGAPGAPSIDVAWKGFEQLGIWSRRGGDFVCVEPWYGYADPLGFEGDFATKPGLMFVEPGASAAFEMRVTVSPARS